MKTKAQQNQDQDQDEAPESESAARKQDHAAAAGCILTFEISPKCGTSKVEVSLIELAEHYAANPASLRGLVLAATRYLAYRSPFEAYSAAELVEAFQTGKGADADYTDLAPDSLAMASLFNADAGKQYAGLFQGWQKITGPRAIAKLEALGRVPLAGAEAKLGWLAGKFSEPAFRELAANSAEFWQAALLHLTKPKPKPRSTSSEAAKF